MGWSAWKVVLWPRRQTARSRRGCARQGLGGDRGERLLGNSRVDGSLETNAEDHGVSGGCGWLVWKRGRTAKAWGRLKEGAIILK